MRFKELSRVRNYCIKFHFKNSKEIEYLNKKYQEFTLESASIWIGFTLQVTYHLRIFYVPEGHAFSTGVRLIFKFK